MKIDEANIIRLISAEYGLSNLTAQQMKSFKKACRKFAHRLASLIQLPRIFGSPGKPRFTEKLHHYAQEMRDKPTKAESILNAELAKMFGPNEYYHQKPMGRYILDFYIPSAHLCIEVDGGYHSVAEQLRKDAERDRWLNRNGIKVRRFKNERVIYHADTVANEIFNECLERIEFKLEQPKPEPKPRRTKPLESKTFGNGKSVMVVGPSKPN